MSRGYPYECVLYDRDDTKLITLSCSAGHCPYLEPGKDMFTGAWGSPEDALLGGVREGKKQWKTEQKGGQMYWYIGAPPLIEPRWDLLLYRPHLPLDDGGYGDGVLKWFPWSIATKYQEFDLTLYVERHVDGDPEYTYKEEPFYPPTMKCRECGEDHKPTERYLHSHETLTDRLWREISQQELKELSLTQQQFDQLSKELGKPMGPGSRLVGCSLILN